MKGRRRMVASMCGIASSKANKCHDLGLHYVLRSWNFVEGNMNAKRYADILEDNILASDYSAFSWEQPYLPRRQRSGLPSPFCHGISEKNKIKTLTWPARSPDLNIIENVWHRLKGQLQNEVECIATTDDLKCKIWHIWQNVPANYIQNLYYSIPRRIKAVLRSSGNIAKY